MQSSADNLVPFAGSHSEADMCGLSAAYRSPVVAVQGVADGAAARGGSLVKQATTSTSFSAIKKIEERNSLLCRICNLTDGVVEETLELGRAVARAWRINLLEERQEELPDATKSAVHLILAPREIVSVEIEFARHA